MKKLMLLSFIFLAVFLSSASAFEGNTSDIFIKGEFVYRAGECNTSECKMYWEMTQLPTEIRGFADGGYLFVAFYPLQDNYTYYIPVNDGSMTFFCNPSNVVLDGSLVCTATVLDYNGSAVNNARVRWALYDYNDIQYDNGDFEFVSNGVYKFRVEITQDNNYTTGDYYLMFDAIGFAKSYSFPVHLSITYLQENVLVIFSLVMLIISISTIVYGYWKRSMSFVVFGSFSLILIAMLMLSEQSLFGETISNVFAVIFSLLGLLFLIQMFLEKWQERRKQKKDKEEMDII